MNASLSPVNSAPPPEFWKKPGRVARQKEEPRKTTVHAGDIRSRRRIDGTSGKFVIKEVFAPYTAEFVLESTDADVVKADDFRIVDIA